MKRFFAPKKGISPIKYLGVPLYYTNLRREDLQPIVDKIIKRIAGWKARLLSYASRLTLLKACLASIPISHVDYSFLNGLFLINSQMSHFLWNNTEDCHKYYLAHWQLVA